MEQVAKQHTRVPSHLRSFHPQTNYPELTDPRVLHHSEDRSARKNSPPRIRLSLRSALKDIISKDWKGLILHVQPERPPMVPPQRPDHVRMKDSDDYITERGANPRTGLISPSLVSSTPCRANTPNTPGDALRLSRQEQASPTPEPRRLLFSKANEGRKISAGSSWVHGEQEAYFDGERTSTPSTLPEDRLVVHMPSAKEPQPFAYPGYSSEQIEAFEHYRHKARRVSSEGYDRRFLQTSRNASSTYSTPECEQSPDTNDAFPYCPRQGHHFQPYNNGMHERPQPQLVVRKRNTVIKPVCQVGEAVSTFADRSGRSQWGKEIPDSSTPVLTCDNKANECCDKHHGLGTIVPGACCTSKPAQHLPTAPEKISKQSCMAPRRGSVQDVAKGNHDDKDNAFNGYSKTVPTGLDTTDLRTLPRVALVRPEHAAMPGLRGPPSRGEGGRQCSLGCRRDVRSGQCLETRKVSGSAGAARLFSTEMPNLKDDTGTRPAERAEEVLVGILTWLLCYIKGIQLPQSDLIETLRSPTATSKEKADALKAALSLAGHVLAVGTALAMIWQLSAAVIQLLQIALWPLAVPFRILRWLLGAA